MQLTTILFDLDGTLLPMDQDEFVKGYFGLLAKKLAPHGYDAKQLVNAIWSGTAAMVQNDGTATNEEVFWQKFVALYGNKALEDKPLFEEFYANEFQQAKAVCGYDERAAQTVRQLKALGLRMALATNPIFPGIATESRIRWAGLEPADFELYTTYENSRHCKPNPAYYADILTRLGLQPEECLMVGNDVSEDMVAQGLGINVFLLTDCVINKNNADISKYPHGSFEQLLAYVKEAL